MTEGERMKTEDGVEIAERWAALYRLTETGACIDAGSYRSTGELRMLIEELSWAEAKVAQIRSAYDRTSQALHDTGLTCLEAERVAALSAPVSDEEWRRFRTVAALADEADPDEFVYREDADAIIAARVLPQGWKTITPKSLPSIGDEVWTKQQRIERVRDDGCIYENCMDRSWLYFRPTSTATANAPAHHWRSNEAP